MVRVDQIHDPRPFGGFGFAVQYPEAFLKHVEQKRRVWVLLTHFLPAELFAGLRDLERRSQPKALGHVAVGTGVTPRRHAAQVCAGPLGQLKRR